MTDGNVKALESRIRELEEEVERLRLVEGACHDGVARYRLLLDASPAPICVYDAIGRVEYVNSSFEETFGWSLAELAGHRIDFVPPHELAKTKEALDQTLTGCSVDIDTQRLTRDGRLVDIQIRTAPFFGPEGELCGDIVIYRDVTREKEAVRALEEHRLHLEAIVEERTRTLEDTNRRLAVELTERQEAQEALRTEKEKFRVLVEESPLGVAVIDADGGYRYVNPKFTEIFGYTSEELPDGKHWFKRMFPDPLTRREALGTWLADLHRASPGQARPRIFTVRTKGGEDKVVHFRPVTLQTGDNFVIYEDISEQKRLETQLLQSQKMEALGTLASGVAHDFNNLLQAISGYAELVLHDLPVGGRSREYMSRIGNAADGAADLVRSLLAFGRKEKAQLRPLDLNREVKNTLRILERTIPKMIDIRLEFAADLSLVNADPNQVEQVVMNLATNARDAMPEGGSLTLETRNVVLDDRYCERHLEAIPGEHVLLCVTDTGIGMDEATARRVFEPFFTTKGVGEGTGLGLSTVYGIVKNHGGHITCTSTPGAGTKFCVYFSSLPPAQPRAATGGIQPSAVVGGTERILVVDDEESVRDLAAALLTARGYSVLTASSGEEAMVVYHNKGPGIDLVILDLGMPGMGGRACLIELRRMNPALKVLVVSGYSIHSQAKGIQEMGAAGFLNKPYRIVELLQTVRQVLDGTQEGRSAEE